MTTRRRGAKQPTKAEEALALERSERAWRVVLGSPDGRLLLWELLILTGYHGPLNLRGEDAMFALGKRAVGWAIREAVLSVDPEAWRLIEQEGDPPPPETPAPEADGPSETT